MNIIDTIESLEATITTLELICNDSDGLDNQIRAAKIVAERNGIDPGYEFSGHHRVQKVPHCNDGRLETAANLGLVEYNRKEFIALLDAQVRALRENQRTVASILQPAVNLLKPPHHDPVDIQHLKQLCNTFPVSIRPDVDALETELTTFCCHLQENHEDIETVHDTLVYLKSHSKSVFSLTRRCFKLLLTCIVPVTSASVERSFSKLKLAKTVHAFSHETGTPHRAFNSCMRTQPNGHDRY